MESGQCMLQLWRLAPLLLYTLMSLRCSAVSAAWAMGSGEQVEPVSFYFSDFEEDLQDLSLLGDAKFVRIEGQVDGMAVQLSGTRKHTVGRLLYSIPINMLDASGNPASFSTFFEFSMTSYAGDGLAFVVVPDKTSIGASGPWLGLVEESEIENMTAQAPHTFAVEFDSVMNMELRDPNSNHVGVDVETIVSAATANASDISVVLNDGTRTYAWISYDGSSSNLEVRISKNLENKPDEPLLSHKVDLSGVFKRWMYVGFSSSTGNFSQKHKIFSWRFWSGPPKLRSNLHSIPLDPATMGAAPESPDESKADRMGLFITLLVGFTCGASFMLFLLVGWALIARKNSSRHGYEEIIS